MSNTVFYSWQQDTPKDIGDSFIEAAIKAALTELHSDMTLDKALRELQIDRDTKNVPGQPPIADTILRKIDSASVFVPDLTFVGKRLDQKRSTPNPNVLIEYGYALKALTHHRIVPVMNTHFGIPSDENMPFDMRHLRHPIQFCCEPNSDRQGRASALEKLSKELKDGIAAVLKTRPSPPTATLFDQRLTLERFRSKAQPIGVTYDPMLLGGSSGPVILADGPAVWFKLAPTFDPARTWRVNEIHKAINGRVGPLIKPLGIYSAGYLRAADGFGIYAINTNTPGTTDRIVFISTNGELIVVWITNYRGHSDRPAIRDRTSDFAMCLKNYSEFLITLGISPPFKWQVVMEGTQDLPIITSGRLGTPTPSGKCLVSVISAGGDYTPDDDPITVLRGFTEKLYDSCGLEPPSTEFYSVQ